VVCEEAGAKCGPSEEVEGDWVGARGLRGTFFCFVNEKMVRFGKICFIPVIIL